MYDDSAAKPAPVPLDAFDPFDDYTLVPQDQEALYNEVDYSFNLDLKMDNLGDGANYAFFNDISYVEPKVPTLYSVLTMGGNVSNPAVYGSNTNAFVLEKDQVVEIVLNNDDAGKHPFHLHGKASILPICVESITDADCCQVTTSKPSGAAKRTPAFGTQTITPPSPRRPCAAIPSWFGRKATSSCASKPTTLE